MHRWSFITKLRRLLKITRVEIWVLYRTSWREGSNGWLLYHQFHLWNPVKIVFSSLHCYTTYTSYVGRTSAPGARARGWGIEPPYSFFCNLLPQAKWCFIHWSNDNSIYGMLCKHSLNFMELLKISHCTYKVKWSNGANCSYYCPAAIILSKIYM